MQELIIRKIRTAGQWELAITRDEVNGKVRGYIVGASNDRLSTTLETFGVQHGASVAFAGALRYLRTVEEGIVQTGDLPCYKPRNNRYYN